VDDLMPIGEFSERSGLSAKRLRSYAAAGLLVPAAVDAGSGYRYYAPGQLRDAQLIDALRAAGVPLADIFSLLRDPAPARLEEWAIRIDIDASQRQEALGAARRLLASGHEAPARTEGRAVPALMAATRSDIGRVRENNEDAALCLDHVVAVADGMGGHAGGEVAAALAITLIEAAFTGQSVDELVAAVRAANRAIADRADTMAGLEGMGTTICAAGAMGGGQVAIVNVGDSRAYLFRDGALRQLTDDHTLTAELVRRGELTEAEAAEHPHRNVLTRALGVGATIDVDAAVHDLRPGDRLLLCTDGLFNELTADDIAAVLRGMPKVAAAADALVDRALAHGGHDNVTAVVADLR
jgi:serine/threonine protein phosphatase PrpC